MKELDAEKWFFVIERGMDNIAKGLERLSDTMVKFMAFLEAKQPDLEYRKDGKWITKKAWEKFKPMKEGK